jgi:hypothetical protein
LATRVPARLSAAAGRRFGLTVGGAFLVLAALAWWRGRALGLEVFATLGSLFVLSGLALPTHLGPVFRAWMGLAHQLSRVTTPIVLGLIYFLSVTPIGLVLRLFGRRPLVRRAASPSFWVTRPADTRQRGGMEHQF